MTACFSRGELQIVKVGVQAGVPRAVLPSRVPAPQGAVCWGRDSAACQGQHSACPGSSPRGCGEKLWVEGVTPNKRPRRCCMGQGCSQLQITPTTLAESPFEEGHQGSIFLKGKQFVHWLFCSWGIPSVGDGNFFLCSGEGTETPVLISTYLSCSFASAHTEMSLGSVLLPGGVCRAELSRLRVGWAL